MRRRDLLKIVFCAHYVVYMLFVAALNAWILCGIQFFLFLFFSYLLIRARRRHMFPFNHRPVSITVAINILYAVLLSK